jgi:hypothetical protein
VTWYGPSNAGDGTTPSLPSSLAFTVGVASASITLVTAESVSLYFDDGLLYGIGMDADENLQLLDVSFAAPDTTSLNWYLTGVTTAYSNTANGGFASTITNHTGGGITKVKLFDPDYYDHSKWVFVPAGGHVFDAANSTEVTSSGWTVTTDLDGMVFTASSASVFPDGATLNFQAFNSSGLYPNIGASGFYYYPITLEYYGYRAGSRYYAPNAGAPGLKVVHP